MIDPIFFATRLGTMPHGDFFPNLILDALTRFAQADTAAILEVVYDSEDDCVLAYGPLHVLDVHKREITVGNSPVPIPVDKLREVRIDKFHKRVTTTLLFDEQQAVVEHSHTGRGSINLIVPGGDDESRDNAVADLLRSSIRNEGGYCETPDAEEVREVVERMVEDLSEDQDADLIVRLNEIAGDYGACRAIAVETMHFYRPTDQDAINFRSYLEEGVGGAADERTKSRTASTGPSPR